MIYSIKTAQFEYRCKYYTRPKMDFENHKRFSELDEEKPNRNACGRVSRRRRLFFWSELLPLQDINISQESNLFLIRVFPRATGIRRCGRHFESAAVSYWWKIINKWNGSLATNQSRGTAFYYLWQLPGFFFNCLISSCTGFLSRAISHSAPVLSSCRPVVLTFDCWLSVTCTAMTRVLCFVTTNIDGAPFPQPLRHDKARRQSPCFHSNRFTSSQLSTCQPTATNKWFKWTGQLNRRL